MNKKRFLQTIGLATKRDADDLMSKNLELNEKPNPPAMLGRIAKEH